MENSCQSAPQHGKVKITAGHMPLPWDNLYFEYLKYNEYEAIQSQMSIQLFSMKLSRACIISHTRIVLTWILVASDVQEQQLSPSNATPPRKGLLRYHSSSCLPTLCWVPTLQI